MMHRDLSEAFRIDPDAGDIVRNYIAYEFGPDLLDHWCKRMLDVARSLPEGWRCRLSIKVVKDLDGEEQRFPVIVVEDENLP